MYRNILIPVDLSEKNEVALQTVRRLAHPQAASITLLHVIETLRDVPFEEMQDFYRELGEQAERTLARWTSALAEEGFDARQEIVYGQRGREIVRFAEAHQVDLIVVRSHVLDQAHLVGSFGTLSHQVALLASCSVLLVR